LNTRYETLAQVMGSAKSGGLKRIGFITRPAAAAAPNAAGGATPPNSNPSGL
jgi:biopolymer transport protein ExbD